MPTTNKLTDLAVRRLEPRAKAYKTADGGGLALWISPQGAKVWRLYYRLAGKPQTMSLGTYPTVTLAEARKRRDAARAALAAGEDPMAGRRRPAAATPTLKAACESYWGGRADCTPRYLTNVRRGLEMHVYPALGDRPVGSIARGDFLDVLRRMDAVGRFSYVRKVRLWLKGPLDWAVEHDHVATNEVAAIDPSKAFGRRAVRSFAALTLPEVPGLLQRLALEREIQSVLACWLLAFTWVRTNELRNMVWEEIDGDLWRLPAGKMKRRRDHLVPLSKQALVVLEKLRLRERGSRFVFPSEHRIDRPMSENAVLYLLHRMGFKGRMTGHGFRTVASTWANEAGYPPDAIERQLAHAPQDPVRAIYNRADYLPQRRAMLQAWADWLDVCLAQDPSALQRAAPPAAAAPAQVDVRLGQSAVGHPAPDSLA